jgi:hypothetical protein
VNLLLMPAEHVPWRDVSDGAVQTDVVVMVYVTLNQTARALKRQRRSGTDAFVVTEYSVRSENTGVPFPCGTAGTHSAAASQRTCTTRGVKDKDIQGILRHSTLALTMNIYVKSVAESQVNAMDSLSEKFGICKDHATGRVN